jgi:hypothetical protein
MKPVLLFVWEGTHTLACGVCNVFSNVPINMTMKIACCTKMLPLIVFYVGINTVSPARISVIYLTFNLESYRVFAGLYVF